MGRKTGEKKRYGRTGAVGRIGLIVLALLFAGLLGWWGWRQFLRLSYFEITQVVVEGNLQLTAEEIISGLRLPPHLSLLEVDLMEFRQKLLQNPWVREATVRRQLPFTLIVRVVERVPEVVLMPGKAYLLSADGVILAEASPEETLSLPILKAPSERRYMIGEQVLSPQVVKGLTVWREFQAANAVGGVAREITLEEDGSYMVWLGPSMPLIRLRAEDMEGQFQRLLQVLALAKVDLTAYEYVDLRFGEKVIVKPKEGEEGGQGERPDRRA
ncbi:MAG: FtsQ-type POTRA domain-containing protein [candidate division NC10 bacterium]|nr:FtsQ-type POTRA domain-containing protein [candidate division NC10 bacterium]